MCPVLWQPILLACKCVRLSTAAHFAIVPVAIMFLIRHHLFPLFLPSAPCGCVCAWLFPCFVFLFLFFLNVWILLRNESQCIECMEFPFQSTRSVCCYWYAHYRLWFSFVVTISFALTGWLADERARAIRSLHSLDRHENIITVVE